MLRTTVCWLLMQFQMDAYMEWLVGRYKPHFDATPNKIYF